MAIVINPDDTSMSFYLNASLHRLRIRGKFWPSVEHFYQAQKFEDHTFQERVRAAETASSATRSGRSLELKLGPNWQSRRYQVMYEALVAKFTQHARLKERLLSTGNQSFYFNSPDIYWGMGESGEGNNTFGLLLERIRLEIAGMEAARNGETTVLRNVLNHHPALISFRDHGETPLHVAAKNGNYSEVLILLEKDADVNARVEFPLISNDEVRDNFVVTDNWDQLMFKAGSTLSKIRPTYSSDDTPLHLAAANGHLCICLLLLKFGANRGLENDMSATPVSKATDHNFYALAGILRSYPDPTD
jgi:N-glycosidase YbiA